MNFKTETLEAIEESGHTEQDVKFIGSKDGEFRITIEEFKLISDFDYDCGFGAARIARDLIIYFKDQSYIVRGEYDGSEWWEYNEPLIFDEDTPYKTFTKLGGSGWMWDSVKDKNEGKN